MNTIYDEEQYLNDRRLNELIFKESAPRIIQEGIKAGDIYAYGNWLCWKWMTENLNDMEMIQ